METLKILVPTNFSVTTEYAYAIAKIFRERMDVAIHFMHVLDVPDTVTLDANGDIQTCGDIDADHIVQQKVMAEKKLLALQQLYGEGIQTRLILGKLTDGIIDFAERNQFELIVIGTAGSTGLQEKLSGTEAQFVARRSTVPVLSLMCDPSTLAMKNILLVHDFSRPLATNPGVLLKLLRAFEATLHLLQVNTHNQPANKEVIKNNMEIFAALHHIRNHQFHVANNEDVEKGVMDFEQLANMDLVSIGTHGQGGIFHHSIAEQLINHLRKPLISFHLN